MDMRSLEQNFEVSMIIYDKEVVEIIESDFKDDLTLCSTVEYDEWIKRPRLNQIKESLSRLFSPIL
jgi:cardiolipin synthase